MIDKALSIAEAKAHFSECIDMAVNEGYVLITRYGKPIAAIVDLQDLEQLMRLRAARETGTLANLGNDWEDADEFAQILDDIVQHR
ncbi:MAG: type II toxin-antitoxin system Phd/YefM family antitoxin [Xenococcaceae cyanobacterium MO_188.B29]|nr:type II toxin-antitoxin system Phd/YefM family antitoxin [Xenococcaceae cyanobacterium MO_188.B29]